MKKLKKGMKAKFVGITDDLVEKGETFLIKKIIGNTIICESQKTKRDWEINIALLEAF